MTATGGERLPNRDARGALEGSYLHTGPGRYEVPPSYFLIRGDLNARGSR